MKQVINYDLISKAVAIFKEENPQKEGTLQGVQQHLQKEERKEAMKPCFEAGMPDRMIAELFGLSFSTVCNYKKELGFTKKLRI